MFDPTKVTPRLVAKFMGLARSAASDGKASGSTAEQVVGALLNGRSDWLPEACGKPLDAIMWLHSENEEWWHTMLLVNRRNWAQQAPIYPSER